MMYKYFYVQYGYFTWLYKLTVLRDLPPKEHIFTHFMPFLYPLKIENQRCSNVFKGYRKKPVA